MSAVYTATSDITINLDESDVNSNVNRGALIQQTCYTKLISEITRDLSKEIKKQPNTSYPIGSGFVYFIDGTRGAGKTTFLQTVYESAAGAVTVKLGQLAYIDPSRIEHTEITLLFVLKELKRRVDDQLHSLSTQKTENDYAEFRKSFKAIAGGLSLFKNGHDQLDGLDADLFLDWGLERAGDSAALRDNLHNLISTTCKILNVKALLLAFDDADTNAASAMKVLECIRKYLDTPQLVILVTGDMELYSQQVRDHFYESMGKHIISMDGERREQRTKMVDHLEDQYLLKLFPIRRRIQLVPVWNLIQASSNELKLSRNDDWTDSRTINSAVDEIIQRGLRVKSKHDIELYRSYLLKQPIRSILQVLSRCAGFLSPSDAEGNLSQTWDREFSERLTEGLRSMALGSLYKFGVDVDAIGALEMPALVEAVFELVVRDGDFDTGAYLRPQSRDIALKSSFAALASDVSRFCANDPSNTLLYLFGGPGSVALWGQVLQHKNKEIEGDEGKTEKLRAQFKNYIGTGRKEDALNWAWHASAILTAPYSANPKQRVVQFGVIGLNKRKPSKSTGITAKSAIRECSTVPAFAFSLIDASGRGVGTFASIFNILGLMERLFCLEIADTETLTKAVVNELAKVYPTPTISRPGWQGNEDSTVDEDSELDEPKKDEEVKLEAMAKKIANWLEKTKSLREQLKPSAVLIGKVWTRLYFSLDKVSDQQGKKLDAASLMELFALCVINAFLVEELDHHLLDSIKNATTDKKPSEVTTNASSMDLSTGEPSSQKKTRPLPISQLQIPADKAMNRDNPVGSPGTVAKKFSNTLFNVENMPLTFLIASCPLILGLIPAPEEASTAKKISPIYDAMIKKLSVFGASNQDLCQKSDWDRIKQSLIAGHKWPEKNSKKPDGPIDRNETTFPP